MADDGLKNIEAVLNAVSKITSDEPDDLSDARCPKCQSSSFVSIWDARDQALRRIDDGGDPNTVTEGGFTDTQLVTKFAPPAKRSAVIRVVTVAVPLAIGAVLAGRQYGPLAAKAAGAAAIIVLLMVFLTRTRSLSDEYYDRRRRWRKTFMCRRCGQLVSA